MSLNIIYGIFLCTGSGSDDLAVSYHSHETWLLFRAVAVGCPVLLGAVVPQCLSIVNSSKPLRKEGGGYGIYSS